MAGIGHNGGPPMEQYAEQYDEHGNPIDEEAAAYAIELDKLMGMSVEDILREGQKALFVQLVARARSGKASHQELAVLRNVLRDNGLTLGIPPAGPSGGGSKEALDLPTFGEPEY